MKVSATVWHNNELGNTDSLKSVYRRVATVEVEHNEDVEVMLESIYKLTNSIYNHWTLNEGVTEVGTQPKRSTSVGDMINIGGEKYVVADFGFEWL